MNEPWAEKSIERLTSAVSQKARWILLSYALLTLLALYYTATHLSFHTDTQDMIADHLDWRQDYIQYKKSYPLNHNTIVAVIEGHSLAQVQTASQLLYDRLKNEEAKSFESVYSFQLEPFISNHKLLYLMPSELKSLNEQLNSLKPLLGLQYNQLGQFSTILQHALNNPKSIESLKPLLTHFSKAMDFNQKSIPYFVPWSALLNPTGSSSVFEIIEIKPNIDYETLTPGKQQVELIKQTFNDLRLDEVYGVKLSLTGDVVLNLEELEGVSDGATFSAIAAFVMVAFLLIISFQSIWLVLIGLSTLIVGLIVTAGFATVAIGHLNMISVAFAVLYIGLSIDFSIHLILRYTECLQNKDSTPISTTTTHLGPALMICAITTSCAFFSFLPTSFKGVSELGLIAGGGMLISFIINMTLLPALLTLIKAKSIKINSLNFATLSLPVTHPKIIVVSFSLIIAMSIVLLPLVKFNSDPMALRDQNQPSVQTFYKLNETMRYPLSSITYISHSLEALNNVAHQVSNLESVKDTLYLDRFVPDKQKAKQGLIHDIHKQLPSPSRQQNSTAESSKSREMALKKLASQIKNMNTTAKELIHLQKAIDTFIDFTNQQPNVVKDLHYQALSHSTLLGLEYNVNSIKQSVKASHFNKEDLPESIKNQWENHGQYRLQIFPKHDMQDNKFRHDFVEEVLNIAPHATGLPVIHEKAGIAVVNAFIKAFSIALVFISLFLIVLMRDIRKIILTLVPLLSACLITGGLSVALNVPFNFANIIALPLLLGVGIDNGIHLVHRFYSHKKAGHQLLQSSTSKAVIVSTLTTIFSFANLSFSSHFGMSSMGLMLTIGMGVTFLCTLVFLPALIHLMHGKTEHH